MFGERESVSFCGYTIARATDRDSGAMLGDGISKIDGCIRSSGSMKNWTTCVDGGSVFRLKVPENLLEKYVNSEDWHVKECIA